MKIHSYLEEKLFSVYSFHTLRAEMSNTEEFQSGGFGVMPLSGYNFIENLVRGSIASLLCLKSSQIRRNQKRKFVVTTYISFLCFKLKYRVIKHKPGKSRGLLQGHWASLFLLLDHFLIIDKRQFHFLAYIKSYL